MSTDFIYFQSSQQGSSVLKKQFLIGSWFFQIELEDKSSNFFEFHTHENLNKKTKISLVN